MSVAELLLIGSVAAVGVLHTMVPDHWLPITVMARQRGWSRSETARAALQANIGHLVTTLAAALVFWGAGAVVATRFGHWLEAAASVALIGFGLWVAFSAIRERRHHHAHGHSHTHGHSHERQHEYKIASRMTLLLILGSSPIVEVIPAFFAAGQYGIGLVIVMAVVLVVTTSLTYVLLSVYSASGLQKLRLGRLEAYGEIASGFIIAAVGVVFWAIG